MKLYVGLMLLGATFASANVIVEDVGGTDPTSNPLYWGQSFTTPSGGPWDDLSFSFYAGVPATTAVAGGTAFLLSEEYLGTPGDLSTSTPGFLAESTSASGGAYTFDSSVELQQGTQYWIYENALLQISGGDTGPGELGYVSGSSSNDFVPIILSSAPTSTNYSVSGAVVASTPEPASEGMLLGGLVVAAMLVSRKRRAKA